MATDTTTEVRCLHCDKWFPSPLNFPSMEVLKQSWLMGNRTSCPHCSEMTVCDKDNMRVRGSDSGVVDKDT